MNRDHEARAAHEQLLDEAEAMIWALLDDQLDEAAMARLDQLLATNEEVQRRYLQCVQLHVDLTDHFAPQETSAAGSGILNALLAENLPGADGAATPAD